MIIQLKIIQIYEHNEMKKKQYTWHFVRKIILIISTVIMNKGFYYHARKYYARFENVKIIKQFFFWILQYLHPVIYKNKRKRIINIIDCVHNIMIITWTYCTQVTVLLTRVQVHQIRHNWCVPIDVIIPTIVKYYESDDAYVNTVYNVSYYFIIL